MFSRVAALSVLALPLLAVASPTALEKRQGACNTGAIQCCVQLEESTTNTGKALLSLLGHKHHDAQSFFGFDCSPISSGSVNGPECQASPVCCQNNAVGGIISIGCMPIIF